MKLAPTDAVNQVENLALSLVTHGGIAVVTGEHGTGKSVAATNAKEKAEALPERPKVVLVDCAHEGNAAMFSRALAKAMNLTIPGNQNPVAYFATLKSKLAIRAIRLIIVDNGDHLDEACREHLLRLVDRAGTNHKVGLLVLESSTDEDSFGVTAEDFGYRPRLINMPVLSPEEIAGFLATTFPEIADNLAKHLDSPEAHQLIADLMKLSGGRPRTLADILTSIQIGVGHTTVAEIQTQLSGSDMPTEPKPSKQPKSRLNGHSKQPLA